MSQGLTAFITRVIPWQWSSYSAVNRVVKDVVNDYHKTTLYNYKTVINTREYKNKARKLKNNPKVQLSKRPALQKIDPKAIMRTFEYCCIKERKLEETHFEDFNSRFDEQIFFKIF